MTTDVNVATETKPQDAVAGNLAGQGGSSEDQMISQKQMATVLAREKEKAYERGRMEAEAKLQQAAQPQVQAQPQMLGGMPQLSEEQLRKLIHEETPKAIVNEMQRVQQKNMVDSFVSKMKAAETKYPGLEAKLNELDFSSIAPLIAKVNEMENAGDIMNELVNNPMKMGNLVSLVYTQPRYAQTALAELSNSIKQNEQAKNAHVDPKEPLSNVNPSANANDSGKMTVADFRKMFRV